MCLFPYPNSEQTPCCCVGNGVRRLPARLTIAQSSSDQVELISGGWTYLHLFNPKLHGLDLNPSENQPDQIEESKIAPLFQGTPRLLPFIAAALFEAPSGYPGLVLCPGGTLQYYLISRPDIKRNKVVWKENTFIGPGEDVPGIEKISLRGISLIGGTKINLSMVFYLLTNPD